MAKDSPETPVPQETKDADPEVTIENVRGNEKGVDYNRLLDMFGLCEIDSHDEERDAEGNVVQKKGLIQRMEAITGRPVHHLIRRGLFFAHRDLPQLFDLLEKEGGAPMYLYTGRGPSSEALHLGHLIPFIMTKWLQDAFDCPLVVQLTDDEKYIYKTNLELDQVYQMGRSNARDIIAAGFRPEKTFIFSNLNYVPAMHPTIFEFERRITGSQACAAFGLKPSDCVGKSTFNAVQATPAVSHAFGHMFPTKGRTIPCLIPMGIDQDPYFRLTRDVLGRMKHFKCAQICSKFISALYGRMTKMSASASDTAIYLTDTAEQIESKIRRVCPDPVFDPNEPTGQSAMDVDVVLEYLTFFLEDEALYQKVRQWYMGKGHLPNDEPLDPKDILITTIQRIVSEHQRRRALVTEDVLDEFFGIYPRDTSCVVRRPEYFELLDDACLKHVLHQPCLSDAYNLYNLAAVSQRFGEALRSVPQLQLAGPAPSSLPTRLPLPCAQLFPSPLTAIQQLTTQPAPGFKPPTDTQFCAVVTRFGSMGNVKCLAVDLRCMHAALGCELVKDLTSLALTHAHQGHVTQLHTATHLEHLVIARPVLTQPLIERCVSPQLKSLCVLDVGADMDYIGALPSMDRLETLVMRSSHGAFPSQFQHSLLAAASPSLRHLCAHLTDTHIQHTQRLAQLSSLDLLGSLLTDAQLTSVVAPCCDELRLLCIRECTALTSQAVSQVLATCPSLHTLDCRGVALDAVPPRARELASFHFAPVRMQTVRSLFAMCPNLQQ
eukprot:gnl/Trimastix_PCT/994.p2 GENE.gnl/Trimastix_PCT/994~~gnl/Trimastix_PCT/994.p2  ORF type:complete len:773 (+),score=215.26 gnl/Trimastix_PCT/994:2961-5279(+)